MNTASRIILSLSLIVSVAGVAAADVLTGKDRMTLYTFDKDSNNKSACNGQCAALWPSARPGEASGEGFGEIVRDDGSRQLAYQGKPLYYYINDRKPGDITGTTSRTFGTSCRSAARTSARAPTREAASTEYSY